MDDVRLSGMLMTTTAITRQAAAQRVWPSWPLDVLLWTLVLGPIVSPLFRATGLPLAADTGLLARDLLATYVCPTPERSLLLLSLPMAVCVRCWGATLGLMAARALVGTGAQVGAPLRWFRGMHWVLRLVICALPFLLWPLEIVGQSSGWWLAPLWLLLLNGAQAGFAAGLLFCSLWPGLWPLRRAA